MTVLLYPAWRNKGAALSREFAFPMNSAQPGLSQSKTIRAFSPEVRFMPKLWKKLGHPFASTFLRRVVTDSPFELKSPRFPSGRIFICNG